MCCCWLVKFTVAQTSTDIPVRISAFEAAQAYQSNKLYWTTTCFLEYAHFEIQRSYDGTDYRTINTFQADRLRCQQPFVFSDSASNQLAGKIYYRLKVGDRDGKVYSSKIVAVFTTGSGIAINSFTPTLVTNSASISLSSSETLPAGITVVNTYGTTVYSKPLSLQKGINKIELETQRLPRGKYWMILHTAKYGDKTVPFVKQ
jgi:hypothetical protein